MAHEVPLNRWPERDITQSLLPGCRLRCSLCGESFLKTSSTGCKKDPEKSCFAHGVVLPNIDIILDQETELGRGAQPRPTPRNDEHIQIQFPYFAGPSIIFQLVISQTSDLCNFHQIKRYGKTPLFQNRVSVDTN